MFYEIENMRGEKTTIDITEGNTVVYTVGKRSTKFPLADCSEYTFSFGNRTSRRLVCGEGGIDRLFLIMLHDEERLERNNNDRETDGQWRFERR